VDGRERGTREEKVKTERKEVKVFISSTAQRLSHGRGGKVVLKPEVGKVLGELRISSLNKGGKGASQPQRTKQSIAIGI